MTVLNEPLRPTSKPPRLDSVDLLRGIVMVLMALDHVRDYFTNVRFDPLDLAQTTAGLFATRWITHFCAPAFVFLAGTGAFLSTTRGKSKVDLSRFLFTRGLWLVFVELTIVRFGWLFNLDYHLAIAQVIWVIGWSMVVLAALVFLSTRTITIFGVAMIILHNLLDSVTPEQLGVFNDWWKILHVGGPVEFISGHYLLVAYPLIPWVGVMAAGYGLGSMLLAEENKRRKSLAWLGIGLTGAFILIRASKLYGDPLGWSMQQNALLTFFSFIHCQKYPPSLLYLLITLGPAIAMLPLLERWKGKAAEFFIVFGRVPMFYYILHIPFIHALAVVAAYATGFDPSWMFANSPPWEWPAGYGFSLPIVYLVWTGVIVALFPVCKWYAGVKSRSKSSWLSYL